MLEDQLRPHPLCAPTASLGHVTSTVGTRRWEHSSTHQVRGCLGSTVTSNSGGGVTSKHRRCLQRETSDSHSQHTCQLQCLGSTVTRSERLQVYVVCKGAKCDSHSQHTHDMSTVTLDPLLSCANSVSPGHLHTHTHTRTRTRAHTHTTTHIHL